MTSETLYNAAIEFIGSEPSPFPRQISHWRPTTTLYNEEKDKTIRLKAGFSQRSVSSEEQYLTEIYDNKDRGVAGALLGDTMKEVKMRTRLFLEIGDNSPIHMAHKQMQELDQTLATLYNAKPTWLYSANKSFWAHIPFRALKINTTRYFPLRECIRHIVQCGMDIGIISGKTVYDEEIQKEIKVPNMDIDYGICDDWGRVARMPYTMHFGSVLYNAPRMVVPINPKWSLHTILQEAKDCHFREDFILHEGENHAIRELIKQTDKALTTLEESNKERFKQDGSTLYNIRKGRYAEEIEHIIQCAPKMGDSWSRVIYHLLVPYLQWSSYEEDEAREVVKKCVTLAGEDFYDWEAQFEYDWNRLDENEKPFAPMKLVNFLDLYPELRRYLS
jgi:hypothetical protein